MSFVTASRNYYPGHLIYSEEAFARVLPRQKKDEQCEFCFKSSTELVSCAECLLVKYCGIECQAKDSSDHGIECENMEKLTLNVHVDLVRLLGRILFKIKDKDWKTITRNVMGTDVSFEDIDSHYEEMTTNPRFILLYKALKKSLKNFIGEEILPEEENLIKIIGKVLFNYGTFSTALSDFYFGMSKFEHQCIPNSNLEIKNDVMKVWAIQKIGNSEKVTITHKNILTSDTVRSPINEDSLELCKCTECSLPYGESVLTKILDEERAYTVIKFSERVIRIAQALSKLNLENNSTMKRLVDSALQQHEGVLGYTNALHLKLLATKVMILDGEDVQKKYYLIELEKHMRTAFGEFYLELHDIYKGLIATSFNSGNVLEAAYYLKKLKPLQIHQPKEN